jgi:hypothetical protein
MHTPMLPVHTDAFAANAGAVPDKVVTAVDVVRPLTALAPESVDPTVIVVV